MELTVYYNAIYIPKYEYVKRPELFGRVANETNCEIKCTTHLELVVTGDLYKFIVALSGYFDIKVC